MGGVFHPEGAVKSFDKLLFVEVIGLKVAGNIGFMVTLARASGGR